MIKWVDDKSVLIHDKKEYKSGMEIPEGILTDERIEHFINKKKIKIVDYIEVDKNDKKTKKKSSRKSVNSVQSENKEDYKPGSVDVASTKK